MEMGHHLVWGPGVLVDVTTLSPASPAFGNSPEKTELFSGCFQGFLLQLLGPACSPRGTELPEGPQSLSQGPTGRPCSLRPGLLGVLPASLPDFAPLFPCWGACI